MGVNAFEFFFGQIDYDLLKKQKEILYNNLESGNIKAEDVIELEGLVYLIDAIEDLAEEEGLRKIDKTDEL